MMEWILELLERIVCRLAIMALARLAQTLPRVKRLVISVYYRRCYYAGSTLMSILCWLKHPISGARRAEAEFSAGWDWPDAYDMPARIG